MQFGVSIYGITSARKSRLADLRGTSHWLGWSCRRASIPLCGVEHYISLYTMLAEVFQFLNYLPGRPGGVILSAYRDQ